MSSKLSNSFEKVKAEADAAWAAQEQRFIDFLAQKAEDLIMVDDDELELGSQPPSPAPPNEGEAAATAASATKKIRKDAIVKQRRKWLDSVQEGVKKVAKRA